MLLWIIQSATLSVALIFLVHHLFKFFQSTLTIPKIKDLVNAPTQKYDAMYSIINTNTDDSMKDELKSFFKKQMNSTSIESLPQNMDG